MEYKFRIVKAFTIFTEKGVLNGFGEYGIFWTVCAYRVVKAFRIFIEKR